MRVLCVFIACSLFVLNCATTGGTSSQGESASDLYVLGKVVTPVGNAVSGARISTVPES